jgi:serine/threonine protein kinase
MAPEVVMKEGHNKAADWWSYGVLLYEMLCGQPPFRGDSVQETYDAILSGRWDFVRNVEPSAKDIIRQLLVRDQQHRLGATQTAELKLHKFFDGVDWRSVID